MKVTLVDLFLLRRNARKLFTNKINAKTRDKINLNNEFFS